MTTRILGIDPGSRITGLAVLKHQNNLFTADYCDVFRLADTSDPYERLTDLYAQVSSVITEWKPDYCAIETPVYGKDPLAMLKLGRAQAAIMMSVLHQKLPLSEYYPKAVKKAITGTGNASKNQVAYMLYKMITIHDEKLPADATDALAVAWCHFQKLHDPGRGVQSPSSSGQKSRKNNWSSFVRSNPDRIRE